MCPSHIGHHWGQFSRSMSNEIGRKVAVQFAVPARNARGEIYGKAEDPYPFKGV